MSNPRAFTVPFFFFFGGGGGGTEHFSGKKLSIKVEHFSGEIRA